MSYIGRTPTNAALTAADLADGIVSSAKIAADAVTSAKIADNAVVTAAINADAVTGAQLADDAVNSEHYTDGSIDTAHLADGQVTTAKVADDAITAAKINTDIISGTTELAVKPANTDELLISDSGTLKRIDFKHLSNYPVVSVTKSGNQSIDNAETMTKVTFDQTVVNSGVFSSSRFTPGIAGFYFIVAAFRVEANADNLTNIVTGQLYINGSKWAKSDSRVDFRDNEGRGAGVTCTALLELDDDDYIELYGGNNADSDNSYIMASGTTFAAFRLTGQ